ncbi:MAG: histidine kinase [Candidatus Aminicenantes bacterium]|nr:histidine kinase [Candidatus Aminicenantes bacterium]
MRIKKKVIHLCFLILFVLSNTITLFAVNENIDIRFERITVEQGLSHSTIFSILQDREGFIWFGTESGLNRYDGYNFKVFTHIPGDHQSLSSNLIRAIYEDRSGSLWIGTWGGGLNKFDSVKETFTCYKINPAGKNSFLSNQIRAIYEYPPGVMWVGTSSGLHKFDLEKETFTRCAINSQNKKLRGYNIVNAICEDQTGNFWVGTAAGLYKFDRERQEFIHFKEVPIQSIYKDRSGIIWIGTANGLKKLVREKDIFNFYKVCCDTGVHSIYEDKSGVLWIGTEAGLNRFDRGKGRSTRYKEVPWDAKSLSHNFVLSIYEDRSSVIWVGTRAGLNKFNREKKQFKHLRHIPSNANSLSNNYVWSLFEDSSGMLWIGTDDGLNRYDRQKDLFTCYKHDPGNSKSLSDSVIYSIHEDRAGNFWIGTANGLDRFNRERGFFTHYKTDRSNPNSLSGNVILQIFADRSGLLWIGTFPGGLNTFDPRQGKFTRYTSDSRVPGSISSNTITSIYEDRSGVIWIGTYRGLNKFDREQGIFTRYQNDPWNPNSLSSAEIESIYEDSSGMLWLGIHGGLSRFDRETEVFTSYTRKYGLPHVIYGILEDDHGSLWLSSNKGIYKFNPATGALKSYDISDGLQGYHFNRGASFKSKKGEMFFGGANGFNAFFPDEIKDNPYIPPVVITSFKVFTRDYKLEKSILQTRALKLSYDDSFSFEFAALCFSEPDRNRYAYKLGDIHSDWIELGNKREITFSNLSPGHYTLKVKGSNDDGVWNEKGRELEITIIPPFWQSWWFRISILMIVSGLLTFFIRLRIKRIKEKSKLEQFQLKLEMEKQQLENELKLKADFTAMLVHDLRNPLTSVMGFAEMLSETPSLLDTKKTGQVISNSSEKMLKLINDMLDFSKFEAGKMVVDKKKSSIWGEIDEIVEIMRPLFNKKSVKLLYEISPGMNKIVLSIDKEKIGQVLSNILGNAIKFVPEKGVITLGISEAAKGMVEISVKDNGPGIPREKQKYLFDRYSPLSSKGRIKGTGLGLAVSKLIIEAHGGTIGYRAGEGGTGSVFFFRLPHGEKKEILAVRGTV